MSASDRYKNRNRTRTDGLLQPTKSAPTRKKLELEYDSSNKSYHIAYHEISFSEDRDTWTAQLGEWAYPSRGAALNFLKPQIKGDWVLVAPGIHEAKLKSRHNLYPGAVRVRVKSVMILLPEDCQSESLVEENK